jgi:hypothetical protein
MKGIIFNLLEQVVAQEYGEDTWDQLLDTAGIDGAYTAVGNYPHEELLQLVKAASSALGTPPDDLVRWFGRKAVPLLAQRYAVFFEGHDSARSFLLTLNDVIHPEVRKLFPGAYAPSFEFDTSREDAVGLSYFSHRNLCSFAEGLIEGAADHYGQDVTIEQTECAKRGDDKCLIWATLRRRAA